MLASGEPFGVANYGDGEWSCILGASGENCDGHRYSPELAEDLRHTLFEPGGYLYGTNPGDRLRPVVTDWVEAHGVDVRWVEKNELSDANWRGELGPVFAELRKKNVMMVGPPHLRHLPAEVVEPVDVITVPPVNCYDAIHETLAAIRRDCVNVDVVTFSASMASNVMIHRLYDEMGGDVTLIDLGAIFDPYCGVNSRKRYRDPENPERISRNIGTTNDPD